MAYKRRPMTTANPRTARVSGGFKVGSSGAVGTTYGEGFSVARASTGTYTITLSDYYPTLVSFTGGLRLASADGDAVVNFGAFSASNKTLTLKTVLNHAVADCSTNDYVHFDLELNCSSVAGG